MTPATSIPLGVTPVGHDTCQALVWAPRADHVTIVTDGTGVRLDPAGHGYHLGPVRGLGPGDRYRIRLSRPDGEVEHPDPASRWQPEGVHGRSAVDDPAAHDWSDAGWHAPARHELVISEIHVGTFTEQGTLDAAIERLPVLAADGITAVELMPVSAFPGDRNWGYDGVLPYSVHDAYGGPAALRRFVDAAHAEGVAVLLDVVYNHLGPEGNVLADFGPYFTDRYGTPWGQAVNVDGAGSDAVRRYLVENAVRWITDFHLDGLRLDAVHAIHDESAVHFLEELVVEVHAAAARLRRRVHVIAESDLNDARLVRRREIGGYGLDGVWNDDFHHAVHVLLTGEQDGYYADYGTVDDLARCYTRRYALAGDYSVSRGRRHGEPARDVPHDRFVVCIQNHDQIGNRAAGERPIEALPFDQRRLAATVLLGSPFVPLLFMGEEHGAPEPFPYFVSHTDPDLVEAVRTGRREEFAAFDWQGSVPDPQAEETFRRAVIDWSRREEGDHAALLALTRELLRIRRGTPAISGPEPAEVEARAVDSVLVAGMRRGGSAVTLVANFHEHARTVTLDAPVTAVLVDTADTRWGGTGDGVAVDQNSVSLAGHTAALLATTKDLM